MIIQYGTNLYEVNSYLDWLLDHTVGGRADTESNDNEPSRSWLDFRKSEVFIKASRENKWLVNALKTMGMEPAYQRNIIWFLRFEVIYSDTEAEARRGKFEVVE